MSAILSPSSTSRHLSKLAHTRRNAGWLSVLLLMCPLTLQAADSIFDKIVRGSEWGFELAKMPTVGLASAIFNSLMISNIFGSRPTGLTDEDLNKIRDIVGGEISRAKYKEALIAFDALSTSTGLYRRSRKPSEWQNQQQDLNNKLQQFWTCLKNFEAAGNASTPFFIDAATLYSHVAFEYWALTGLLGSQDEVNGNLDVLQPRFVRLSQTLQSRIDWINQQKETVTVGYSPIHWYYRSSKAKYRGYYNAQITSPTGAVLWQSAEEFSTPLVYAWEKSGYRPNMSGLYPAELAKGKEDYVKFMHLSTATELRDRLLNRFSKLACRTFSSDMSIFASRVDGQGYHSTIVTPNGFGGHAVFGPYMYFDMDICHAAFFCRFKSKDAVSTGSGPRLMAMDHDGYKDSNWQSRIMAEDNLDAFSRFPVGDQFSFFGTDSSSQLRNCNQEFRVWMDNAYPNTSVEFTNFRLVGFVDNAHPAPPAASDG